MKAIIKQHPDIDFFIGIIGGPEIPTKQDKFKLLESYQALVMDIDGVEKDLTKEFDLYIKKKGGSTLQVFEENLREAIKKQLTKEHPYKKGIKLEVIVSVSMNEKRLKVVDIDNLLKSVLDCFTGLVYEDDSQIVNVLGMKNANPVTPVNMLQVGIRKVDKNNPSWFKDVQITNFDYEE